MTSNAPNYSCNPSSQYPHYKQWYVIYLISVLNAITLCCTIYRFAMHIFFSYPRDSLIIFFLGNPADDDQNSLTAGKFGYILLQNFHLIDKITHFNRERIAERVVHAIGAGAHEHFGNL